MNTEKIKLKEKIGYGFGDLAACLFWKIFGMYLLFFYTDVFGISAAAAGTLLLVSRIWDAVNDPLMGMIADRTKSRWGKYRPYLLWSAVPFAAIGVATFYTPNFDASGKLVYAYITYTLMMMVYTAINVPCASLLGVMSSDPKERNILASYRMAFAFIGSFITFMLLQPLVDYFGKGGTVSVTEGISTEPMAWTKAVAIIGVISAVFFYFCFRLTKERVVQIDKDADKTTIAKDLKLLLKNKPWLILTATILVASMFNALRDTVAVYYFKFYILDNYKMQTTGWTLTTIYFLVGQAANLAGVVMAPSLSNRFGKKNTFIIALLLAAFLSCGFFFVKNIAEIMALQIAVSVCAGYILPLLWSMFSDICDHHEFTTGRRASGLIFSSSTMAQKFGWAVTTAMVAWMLAAFGYISPTGAEVVTQPDSVILCMRLLISFLPTASCVIAVIGMFFYPLSDKTVKEISEKLDEKREKQKLS